MNNSAS